MIVSIKDIYKMIGMLIVSFCAVIVCAMFINYYLDLISVEDLITTNISKVFYDAQCSTSKVVSGLSGGCLLLTTVVLLCFYIGHYIDTHQKQLGIMKALGYTRFSIAKDFWVFGLPIFTGTAFGYLGAHLLMPKLYEIQNKDGYLPDVPISFHPGLCISLIFIPTAFFSLLAIVYSFFKLKTPALWLIREQSMRKVVTAKRDTDMSFLRELEKSNVRQKKSLVFFITFAVFCFAAMTQMSCSMDELASRMMGIMIMTIGIVLAIVTLFIATTSVIKANRKTITMMKVFGYSAKECSKAVLSGYRPWAYLGFVLGTIYQYVLLKIMVTIVFKDVAGMPEYEFDIPVMLITLVVFFILYETIMFSYTKKMEKLSVKEIMLD
ncbi:MAG: ABC transporter permease [Lachnospiraceae bacterium]|nr:ABC transporter permease [Lachnospiraceae bacterium]